MDRQKPRVSRSIDGLSRVSPRSHYFIDGGVSKPNPASAHNRPLPNLQPRPIPYPKTQPVLKQQPAVRPGINRPQPSRPALDIFGQTTSPSSAPQQSLNQTIGNPQQPPVINDRPAPSLLGSSLPTGQYPRQTPAKAKSKWRSPKRIAKTAVISFAVILLAFGGWFGSTLLGNINKVFHGNVFSDAHALISGSSLKESGGRINILLAGDSVDDPNHSGAALADSIMVLSYDPQAKNGFILSIPRDLWVNIPSMGHQKINAANIVSKFNQPGYPSGGMGQLEQIVESDLGIPIDYEALIDYSAFKDAVNAVGGITINIQSPDPRGIYDAYTHLKLPNGEVNLNGDEALNLARARGDGAAGDVSYGLPNSDFSRTMHQRQMLKALFQKATSVGVLTNPLKIASLFNAFGNNVKTDLTLGDLVSLVHLSGGLNLANMTSVTYSYGGAHALLKSYIDPGSGQEALIPASGIDNFSQIQQYYKQLTSSNPIVKESPTVTLLNGSSVVGLAGKEKQVLESKGFNVVSVADASTEYASTLIVDNSGGSKPVSKKELQASIKGSVVTSTSGSSEASEATNYTSDFVVVMGKDWNGSQNSALPVQQ